MRFLGSDNEQKLVKDKVSDGALEENLSPIHSLFPTMPRHNYWKVAPLVKSLCAKHGIEYQCKPLLTAFADIVQ